MASIHALRRRITAAQNVSKTTRAMQMIAASKLKRAQQATLATRPYVEKLSAVTKRVAIKVPQDFSHPYLTPKASGKTMLIVFAPDKGLCGGLITNLLREFYQYQKAEKDIVVMTVGKKVEGYVAYLKNEVIASFLFGTTTPVFSMVYPIIKIINEHYLSKQVQTVKMLSTHFNSLFSQNPTITTLLPVLLPLEEKEEEKAPQYIFEPNATNLLTPLLTHYLEMVVFQHLLESFVSEQAARMIAMQNATSNAKDIITDLRLEYNKTRQARITNEILDISGADVMRGTQHE